LIRKARITREQLAVGDSNALANVCANSTFQTSKYLKIILSIEVWRNYSLICFGTISVYKETAMIIVNYKFKYKSLSINLINLTLAGTGTN